MKKTFLFLVAVMMAVCSKLQATITPTSSQMWWGYYTEGDGSSLDYENDGLGYSSASTFDVSIYVPASHPFVGGSTIKAIRVWLGDIPQISGDMTIWISKTQPTSISSVDYTQKVSRSSLVQGANDIELSTPFTVDNAAIYVGYTISINSQAYPIMCNGKDTENAFFFRHNSEDWLDFNGYGYGKLALRLLLDGNSFPTNCAVVEDFGRVIAQQGETLSVPVVVNNEGKDPITEISYTITTDGGTPTKETTVNVGSLSFNDSKTIYVNLRGDEARKYENIVTVTKVNGVPNTAKQKSATGYLIVTNEKATTVPVVEEFTGTWCGYCPYGIVGMQKTHEAYGDNVVLIAAHSGDVMDIGSYSDVINAYASGYPSSRINRGSYSVYPSSSLVYYLNNSLKEVTQGTIELTARWANDGKTAVKFSTTSKFFYNDNDEQYGIAFVLVEDGLKGSGSSWAQRNFLNGESGSGEMSFWYSAGPYVSGLEYDHVAVAAWDVMNGVSGSVNSTIQSGVEQKFSYKGDIGSNSLIQDKSKLKAIALLIDRANGKIVNAAQAAIEEAGEENITIDDAMMVVDYLLGKNPAGFSESAADMDENGVVDIVDLTLMIEAIRKQ